MASKQETGTRNHLLLSVIALLVSITAVLPQIRANYLVVTQNRAIWGHGALQDVPVNDRQSPSVLEVSGIAFLKNGKLVLAEEYLSRALAARSSRPTTYVLLGDTYFAMGDDELAFETWGHTNAKQVLKWRRTSAAVNRNWEAVLRYLTLAARVVPQDSETYSLLGDVYMRFNRRSEAATAYFEAAEHSLDPYQSALLQGKAAYVIPDWDRALSAYKRAEQIAPGQAEPYYRQGSILYWGYGKLEDAVRMLEKAIEVEPSNTQFYLTLVQIYDKDRNYERSDFWFQKARAIAPDDPAVLYQPMRSLIARGDYQQAAPLVEHMSTLNPRDDSIWDLRGEVLMKLDQPEDAVASYRTAVSLMPTNGVYRIHLAQAQLAIGQYCEALKEAELAERASPMVSSIVNQAAAVRDAATSLCR